MKGVDPRCWKIHDFYFGARFRVIQNIGKLWAAIFWIRAGNSQGMVLVFHFLQYFIGGKNLNWILDKEPTKMINDDVDIRVSDTHDRYRHLVHWVEKLARALREDLY